MVTFARGKVLDVTVKVYLSDFKFWKHVTHSKIIVMIHKTASVTRKMWDIQGEMFWLNGTQRRPKHEWKVYI
jgi:hypothetical protein